jgi:hypothetical protein
LIKTDNSASGVPTGDNNNVKVDLMAQWVVLNTTIDDNVTFHSRTNH